MIENKRKRTETASEKPAKLKKHAAKTDKETSSKPKFSKNATKPFADKSKKTLAGKPNTFSKSHDKNKFHSKGKPQTNKPESTEPPNWPEFKKKKKELRETRRISKISKTQPDAHGIIVKAKALSEILRRKKGTVDERVKITEELHKLLRGGHYAPMALAHDTTRIIQWLLKFAAPHIRVEVSRQLLPSVPVMLQSKYARNCVKRVLKYGSGETRAQVLTAMHGNVVKLASHVLSAPVLDYAYGEIAIRKQKLCLQQEFYGDIYKTSKDMSITTLADTYKKSPEMKAAMLGATKANLLRVLNKNVHDCGLVHAVLYEYMKECSSEDRSELITTLSPLIAALSNSKEGARSAAVCVWHGSNKDKKTILKVVKEHAIALGTHEHGHLLVLAILSSVDDTVLVGKALLSVLLQDVEKIASEEWGRKVLLWLVAPGCTSHFHPTTTKWLRTGAQLGGSKKPTAQREEELLRAALPALLSALSANPQLWLDSGARGLLTVAVLKAASGEDLKGALDIVSAHICKEGWTLQEEGKEVPGIEHAGLHVCLKKLAQNDKTAASGDPTFGESMTRHLTSQVINNWITTNRGCFFLIALFENNAEGIQAALKKLLLPESKKLTKQATAGAKILLSKIV